MKERIEKKLGCTIEEYIKKRLEFLNEYKGLEIETPNPLVNLDADELDFLGEYLKKIA